MTSELRPGEALTLWEEVEAGPRGLPQRLAAVSSELGALALAVDGAAREAPVSRSEWPAAAERLRRAARQIERARGVVGGGR